MMKLKMFDIAKTKSMIAVKKEESEIIEKIESLKQLIYNSLFLRTDSILITNMLDEVSKHINDKYLEIFIKVKSTGDN